MNTAYYLHNARLVLKDHVLEQGAILLEDGVIQAINPSVVADHVQKIDLKGQTLIPGLIDLHCDALEKEVEP